MNVMSPGHARRRAAASSVAPICLIWTLPASLQRTRRSRPDRRTSLCESFLAFAGALPVVETRRKELSGPVERRGRLVEDRVIGLEDVGHPGGDVERDLDVS